MVVIIPPPPLLRRLIAIRVAAVFHLFLFLLLFVVVFCDGGILELFCLFVFPSVPKNERKKKNSLLSDCCGRDLCSGLLLVGVFLETLF